MRFVMLLVVWAGLGLAQTAPASWTEKTERTVGGPEADLVVRTGDINNLGFGCLRGLIPFQASRHRRMGIRGRRNLTRQAGQIASC